MAQELLEESRSIRFKYVVLVSDGDTKVLPYVKDTYGLNSVTKELCVGHAGKLLSEDLKDMRENRIHLVSPKEENKLAHPGKAGHLKEIKVYLMTN